MDTRLLLSKLITLIYRTRQINLDGYDNVMLSAIGLVKIDKNEDSYMGMSATKELAEYVINLLNSQEQINIDGLLLTLNVKLSNDQELLTILKSSLLKPLEEMEIKELIRSLVSDLNNFIREQKTLDIINKYSYDFKFNRSGIPNLSNFLTEMIRDLEPLSLRSEMVKDPAIVKKVNFDNLNDIKDVFMNVKKRNEDTGIYITGWRALNRMLQGGIREGEFGIIGALQHKYKTGFTMSLFMQLATLNKPIMTQEEIDKGLKPLMIRFSLEDSLENNYQFMFQYLKACDGHVMKGKELEKFSEAEMAAYVDSKMTQNGWSIETLRIDPSRWTYADMFNYILQCEADGYKVCIVVMDYLLMMPTTGCVQGPAGTDKRDLVRRTRNFMSAKGITFITPAQLSTEAKNLVRNGVSDARLVKEIAEKGYYADCKQLDQEVDWELYIHIAAQGNKKYLTVGRGKHRLPTQLESDEYKYFILPFVQPNVPILEDIHGEDSSLRSMPRASGGFDDSGIYE